MSSKSNPHTSMRLPKIWYSLLWLHLCGCIAGCQGFGPQGREFSQELMEERLKHGPLQAVASPPEYILLDGYPPKYRDAIAEGIDAARSFLGEYGPVRVYILGQTDDGPGTEIGTETGTEEGRQLFLERYCQPRRLSAPDGYSEDCAGGPGQRLLDVASSGGQEAYQSLVIHTDPPYSELVFINAHDWGATDMPLRGIHEYYHAFQCSHREAPGWLMEGGAVFHEVWIGAQHGWVDSTQAMRRSLNNALEAVALGKELSDMEYTRDVPADMEPFHRQVAYDMGCWAVAFMIGNSEERSVAQFRDQFYPLLQKSGWRSAVAEYCGRESLAKFYRDFEVFLQRPTADHMDLYRSLRP